MAFLPDDVLANVLSRLPGMEIARLRHVSRQFLHVSEDYYRKLTLPTAMNVKLQFNKEYRNQVAVSIITFHDTEAKKTESPNCILCSATELTVFSHFRPAFYHFQRKYEVSPTAGNSSSVAVPVNSLAESLALLFDWLKRNVFIGRLQINQDDFVLDKEIMGVIRDYGKFVASRQAIPSLRWSLSTEPEEEHVQLLNSYNEWRCILVVSSLKIETLQKISVPRLILLKPEGDPREKVYGPLFRGDEIPKLISSLTKEWKAGKRVILEFKCRCEYDSNVGYLWQGMVSEPGNEALPVADWRKVPDTLLIISQRAEKLVLFNKRSNYVKPTVDCRRLTKAISQDVE